MIRCQLALLMGENKMRISDVIRETGLRRNTLTLIYKETARKVDIDAIDKLCDLFDCDVHDLCEHVPGARYAKKLFDDETKVKKSLKEAQDALLLSVFKHYPTLSEADIRTLIVDDKWLASLKTGVVAEIERVTQQLAKRVKELEERYAEPLPAIEESVALLSNKVAEHLKAMGLKI